MNDWITPKEIAKGFEEFPPIPINTQNVARSKGFLQYLKIGVNVYYKSEWIKDYINRNIRPLSNQTKELPNASN